MRNKIRLPRILVSVREEERADWGSFYGFRKGHGVGYCWCDCFVVGCFVVGSVRGMRWHVSPRTVSIYRRAIIEDTDIIEMADSYDKRVRLFSGNVFSAPCTTRRQYVWY